MSKEKRRDLRILINTNSPHAGSGYSVEMRDVVFRLVRDGWPIAISAFFGIQSYPAFLYGEDLIDDRFKGVKVKCYPQMEDPWGSDAMVFHSQDFKANVVMSMQDVWPLQPHWLRQLKTWCPYLPIDKYPAPPNVLENLKYAYKIFTFCDFGKKTLEDAGFSSTKIYEGTDLEIFKPLDKMECRKKLSIPPDAFVFGMVGANKENPPRKGYQEAMEAFKMFLDKHPDAHLFFHIQQKAPGRFPIIGFAKHLGIAERVFTMGSYKASFGSGSNVINEEYNAFDVLLHPSQTEGFGLCIIEAEATGTPVVIQNSQSMPELIIEGKTGWGANTAYTRFSTDMSWIHIASVREVYECMEKAYEAVKKDPKKVAKDCRDWIDKKFDIDKLVETRWIPELEKLQDELLPS